MKRWLVYSMVFFFTIGLSSSVVYADNMGQGGAERQKSNKTVTLPHNSAKGKGQKMGHGKKIYENDDTWMDYLFDEIGDRKLYDIAIPGSHDAGMNEDDKDNCNLGVSCNTITQDGNILYQLNRGSRYFDIRPVIHEDSTGWDWCTGHFIDTSEGFFGCEGECKIDIVNDLQHFYEDSSHDNELVILKISHCFTRDDNHHCDGSHLRTLVHNLVGHLSPLLVKCDDGCNLMDMTLNEILDKGNIILLVAGVDSDKAKGIFHWSDGGGDLPVFDKYANTDDYDDMKDDQYWKLYKHYDKYSTELFLLSWTLTMTTEEAIECKITWWHKNSILIMADSANEHLNSKLQNWVQEGWITRSRFPNIIYVDAFGTFATSAANYLNNLDKSVPLWATGTEGHPGAYYVMQSDGNFVIRDVDGTALWATGTYGHPGAKLSMQGDGNLVIHDETTVPLWATGTEGHPGAYYATQSDGNFVIRDVDGTALWATGTEGHPGAYYAMQDDGNFVIYQKQNVALWATGTYGHPGAYYVMQSDGNFVIYDEVKTALWATGTYGHPGANYVMQSDGNFVIRDADGTALWATGTYGHPGADFKMQSDGNFVIRDVDGTALWASGTYDHPGAYYEMQGDGNFVIYQTQRVPLWATDTYDHPGADFVMQSDGNFVIRDVDGTALWATGTYGHPGAYYVMQNDGNFVIYQTQNVALWATGTEGHPGAHYAMQHDGNFVIYGPSLKPLWASGTGGHYGAYYVMQNDGNFVIYSEPWNR